MKVKKKIVVEWNVIEIEKVKNKWKIDFLGFVILERFFRV